MSSTTESLTDAVRDTLLIGSAGERQTGSTRTAFDDEDYAMSHGRRGDCHIFVYDTYLDLHIPRRACADHDTRGCQNAFAKLGFDVQIHKNKSKRHVLEKILEVSEADHSRCDAFVMLFMSHGDTDRRGDELLHVYDGMISARALWAPFEGDECATLAGKPKMFFIQACRGTGVDPGVALRVTTDSAPPALPPKLRRQYVVPSQADFLIMWAAEKGKAAFKTERNGISGSVFIHFLCLNLLRYGASHPMDLILLKTTRCVALQFESACSDHALDAKKQVPQTVSTLLRAVRFPPA